MPDRAVVFIDGNNWFHAIRDAGVDDRARLDYRLISLKLLGSREWVGTRYYIGRVPQRGDVRLYAEQRRFLAALEAGDPKISTHLGRLEPRTVDNPAAHELQSYLSPLTARIDTSTTTSCRSPATIVSGMDPLRGGGIGSRIHP